jgi:hypothetical protein
MIRPTTPTRHRTQRDALAYPLGIAPFHVIERDGSVRTATEAETLNARHRRRAQLRERIA